MYAHNPRQGPLRAQVLRPLISDRRDKLSFLHSPTFQAALPPSIFKSRNEREKKPALFKMTLMCCGGVTRRSKK